MIYFTPNEILISILYAAIYGMGCAFFLAIASVIKGLLKDIKLCMKQIFNYEKLRQSIFLSGITSDEKIGSVSTFFGTIFFALGFILLSYVALDGIIRVYMLIIVFASFYLSKFVFLSVFKHIIAKILQIVLKFLTIILRFLLYPFCRIYRKMRTKFVKKRIS